MNAFDYFKQISAIPHPSGSEQQLARFLCDFAKEHGLYYTMDETNNVFIRRPAAKGFEQLPPVLLQAHTDMVCEKTAGSDFDFLTQPIELVIKGDKVTANGTTLGADDGAGVAVMLEILADEGLQTREIECLFTSSEETGMEGAFGFDFSQVASSLMINLDSEEELNACIGCAGGMRSYVKIPLERVRFSGKAYKISVSGLAGGHSGTEIDRGRRSAVKIMGEVLDRLYESYPLHIASFNGEGRDNVIPFSCDAVVSFYNDSDIKSAKALIPDLAKEIKSTLCRDDKGFKLTVKSAEPSDGMLSLKSSSKLISAIMLAPQGVTDRETEKGIVLASVNMGSFALNGEMLEMGFLIRSGNEIYCKRTANVIRRMAHVLGGVSEAGGSYPGWDFRNGGALQEAYKSACLKIFGKEPIFTVIHAGLECGIISHELRRYGKDPDIISIGPDVRDIHTPEESLGIASLGRMAEIVREMLISL